MRVGISDESSKLCGCEICDGKEMSGCERRGKRRGRCSAGV